MQSIQSQWRQQQWQQILLIQQQPQSAATPMCRTITIWLRHTHFQAIAHAFSLAQAAWCFLRTFSGHPLLPSILFNPPRPHSSSAEVPHFSHNLPGKRSSVRLISCMVRPESATISATMVFPTALCPWLCRLPETCTHNKYVH